MTQRELLRIAELITIQYALHGLTVNDTVVLYNAKLLSDLPFDRVCSAFEQYSKTNKTGKPPMAAHIRDIVLPLMSPKEIAVDIGATISKAVTKFGWSNPEGAKEAIGPIGWQVVQVFGGWSHLCENLGATINTTTFLAQARDMAASFSKKEEVANQPADQRALSASVSNLISFKDMPK